MNTTNSLKQLTLGTLLLAAAVLLGATVGPAKAATGGAPDCGQTLAEYR